MRLVTIQLGADTPFWFLGEDGKVMLTYEKPDSGLVDIEALDEDDIKTINSGIRARYIKVFDEDQRRLFDLNLASLVNCEYNVNTEDLEEPELPEIPSVTIREDSEEEEVLTISEKDYEEAEILLSKNGNTVKKSILQFSVSPNLIPFLTACLELEQAGKQRKAVLGALQEKLNG
jgi:hypothetical protein